MTEPRYTLDITITDANLEELKERVNEVLKKVENFEQGQQNSGWKQPVLYSTYPKDNGFIFRLFKLPAKSCTCTCNCPKCKTS